MTDLELDLDMLVSLLEASDIEARRRERPFQASAAHALQIELWRQRRELIGAAAAHAAEAVEACAPFGRVAGLLKPGAGGVLLSIRAASKATDYVQLRPAHFHAAARLAGIAHGC